MAQKGPDFYDDPAVFARYQAPRADSDNPRVVLEKPVFDELAGELAGLRILDLGCGDARFGREALEQGCRSYTGVEGSQKMFALAQQILAGTQGRLIQARLEDWEFPNEEFDLVTARLVLHYIENLPALCTQVYRALVPGGRLIFSVEHPVITSCNRGWKSGELRQEWLVDDYFATGPRLTNWKGGEVIKFHRTVEDYFIILRAAGFVVEALRESKPKRALFADEATYQRRKRIPLMLFLSARRPQDT